MKKRILISLFLAIALVVISLLPKLSGLSSGTEGHSASQTDFSQQPVSEQDGTDNLAEAEQTSTLENSEKDDPTKAENTTNSSASEEETLRKELETAFNRAMLFAWNWFWDTKEIDRNDAIVQEYEGYDTNFYAVSADGISKKDDVRRLACQYFTESAVDDLMAQKGWVEKEGKLYVSEPLGLGGSVPDQLYVSIKKEKTDCYAISLYEKMPNNGGVFTKELQYFLENGNWVFDRAWANMGKPRSLLPFDYFSYPPVKDASVMSRSFNFSIDPLNPDWVQYSYSYPKINLKGNNFDKINQSLNDTFQPLIDSISGLRYDDYSSMISGGLTYNWFVNDDILTILIANEVNPHRSGGTEYTIYHVSMSTGAELSDEDILKIEGFTREEFWQKVKEVAGTRFWNGFEPTSEVFDDPDFTEFFNKQLKKTLADTNIVRARPYLSEAGSLHIVVPVYSMAGADYYWQDLDLYNCQVVPYYTEAITKH